MTEEDLVAKYGRKNFSKSDGDIENNETSSSSSKTQADKVQTVEKKEIKSSIQDVISKYSSELQDLSSSTIHNSKKVHKQETRFMKNLKVILVLFIVYAVACIIVSFIMNPQINDESKQIINKINKAEDLYYEKVKKYHYFSRTDYDYTLGIDLNEYKYFTSYEVVRDEQTGNYMVKLYGATNSFTITYFVIKNGL